MAQPMPAFDRPSHRPVVYGSLWAGCPVRDRSNLQFSIIPVHHRRDDRAIVAVANDEFQWGRSIAVPVNRVKRQQIPDDHTKFRPYGASAAAPVGRVRQANVLDHYTGSLSASCCMAKPGVSRDWGCAEGAI